MSMPNWLNDGQPFPNNDNGPFNPNGDSSMAFMPTPTGSSFDFNQLQNQQLQQQRMQNGAARNGSPAFHNPMYQTQSMIPSKRPRPREDSIGASPRQHPGALPASRSQTPQGAYQGFQGAVNGGQPFPGAAPYQQFQQAGNHTGQSPVMQNQAFNPQAPYQRVQTMSPSPFSPAAQNFGTQASPPQSENGSRVNTPQNGGSQYAQGMPYGGVPNQPYTPPLGSTVNGGALSQYNQHLQNQQQQQRINEARMRQTQQQRQQAGTTNPMAQQPNQISPHQLAQIRAQQGQQAQQRPNNPEQLQRTITQWAQQHGQQFNPQPIIAGKPISSIQLFMGVMKMGGSKRVTSMGQWPNVAAFLQFQQPHQMAAVQDLQNYWHTNLSAYEQFFGLQQQQRRARVDPLRASGHVQGGDLASGQDVFSPTKQMHHLPTQQLMQPPPHLQAQFQTPPKHLTPQQHDPRQPLQNGYTTPQQVQGQGRPSNICSMPQPSMQAPPRAVPLQEVRKAPATIPKKLGGSTPKDIPWPRKTQLRSEFEPLADAQAGETANTYGGLEVAPQSPFLNAVDFLLKYKLSVPKREELGLIDVRALTLSLRSGMHAEVRLALDTLATLGMDQSQLNLDNCEDLLETLIECADDQVQLLADHSAEVSDEMLINSYEETVRGCKAESATLQDFAQFSTLQYDLDRAADRLICIATILRNLSFPDPNHSNHFGLADPIVIRFIASAIRNIGTRSMLLRTHQNTLDFSKDILTLLSNVSQYVDLPGKEEALCILHFLLSFAPSPTPNSAEEEELTFSPYAPGSHPYYPDAVNSLAKLLARGDPNRTFYRVIFAADSASSPPFDLLTRAFGLAIAAIPEIGNIKLAGLIDARAPYLLQGLLAAEILAGLIPSTEHELARSWLASQDAFALSLMRIVTGLGKQPPPTPQRHHSGQMLDPDPFGHATIAERGFAVLRKLAEKVKDADGTSKELPYGLAPDKRSVVSALVQPNIPPYVARQLCALSSLDT